MQQFQQVAVSGFIVNDQDEVLVVKRSDTDDFLPGYWEVPGGGTDYGEHPVIALQRELKEETGLDVFVEAPFYVDDYFMESGDEKIHRVEFFFTCRLKDPAQKIALSSEHTDFLWIRKDNTKDVETTEYMQKAVSIFFERI